MRVRKVASKKKNSEKFLKEFSQEFSTVYNLDPKNMDRVLKTELYRNIAVSSKTSGLDECDCDYGTANCPHFSRQIERERIFKKIKKIIDD